VIANEFNKYFLSIAKDLNKRNGLGFYNPENTTPLHYLLQSFKTPFPNIKLNFMSSKEIENIIKSLKPKNSSGYDGISTRILKISSSFISSPLTHFCNKSISYGTFPDRLKYAIVKPLFKKGDRSCIANYRPISLLSSFSKVLEKVMYNRLLTHLCKYSILAKEQFGFRSDSSTKQALFKLINETLQALNSKSPVGSIFFDLEKAFDCLNHDILISKLQFYGVNGKAKLESYLNSRYQRTQVFDEKANLTSFSTWEKITNGVPKDQFWALCCFLFISMICPKF
jgi:hypothetical protein